MEVGDRKCLHDCTYTLTGLSMLCTGFNISLEPAFSVQRLCFVLAYGGVAAVANLRYTLVQALHSMQLSF